MVDSIKQYPNRNNESKIREFITKKDIRLRHAFKSFGYIRAIILKNFIKTIPHF